MMEDKKCVLTIQLFPKFNIDSFIAEKRFFFSFDGVHDDVKFNLNCIELTSTQVPSSCLFYIIWMYKLALHVINLNLILSFIKYKFKEPTIKFLLITYYTQYPNTEISDQN